MIGAFALAALLGAANPAHDVYVWQRRWTPALQTALADSRDLFGGVRVFVAQAGRDGRWLATEADPRAFAGDSRVLTAVVRYDGAGAAPEATKLASFLTELFARWRTAGVAFAGVEIDYDCGAMHLADYSKRLHDLRAALPREMRLSITALPSWQNASSLDAVLAEADEAVLQVHAVQDPSRGLFDADVAERWIRAFAPHAHGGFRVALPVYGMRVRFGDDGRAVAVESEMAVDAAATDGARELRAEPADVVRLLARLAGDPPPNFRGVAWFRLPLPGDRRAWTITALRDVIAGRVPQARIGVEIVASDGASDLVVVNDGAADAPAAPVRVSGNDCKAADAAAGWRGEPVADGWRFVPEAALYIRAGTKRAVGWVRCASAAEARVE